nr:MAG TPA: hypothetical protein [Caudoviricetes sp.]
MESSITPTQCGMVCSSHAHITHILFHFGINTLQRKGKATHKRRFSLFLFKKYLTFFIKYGIIK